MSKIKKRWQVFCLLMYKNLLIRKRHWKTAIFVQILIPIGLFLFAQAIRDSAATQPQPVTNDTIHEKQSMDIKLQISKQIQLYYVYQDIHSREIMTYVRTCLGLPDSALKEFLTEQDALSTYTLEQNTENPDKVVMILFQSKSDSKVYDYVLRTQKSMPHALFITPGMAEIINFMMFEFDTPFIQLQHCLNMEFIERHVDKQSGIDTEVYTQQMPSPPYIQIDPNDIVIRAFVSFIASIALLIPLFTESNFAASEKFIGVNVLMAMNGVKTSWNLLSWLTSGLLFSVLYISPVVILFKITFSSKVYPFLYYSNGFTFWLFLFLHMSHLLMFGMHVTSYFSKPIFMSSGIMIAYICSSLILKYTAWTSFTKYTPYVGVFFPSILLFRAFEEVNLYESKLTGIQWNNLFFVADQTYNVSGSVGMIMIFSIIGTVLHFYLTLYIYAVKPGKYGVKKHMLYFLESFRRNKINTATSVSPLRYTNTSEPFEPVSDSSIAGIEIRNLKKTYCTSLFNKSCSVDALKGVSIDFHKGQITALLGHNGAGKTTMMSILTGMISPTDGTVLINGKNISKDLDSIMNDLGLCPQDDILFPDLSVFEQLLFFGLLKRKDKNKNEIKRDIDHLLVKLNLSAKRNSLPAQLSGGQKRRVCLGMALIGNANTLILDEPTSGMDPESRRDTWDIILSMREEKTIVISTHNMEEADILGDRIAIIHSGLLRCHGTSMFLKRIYGQGNMEVTLSTNPNCDSENVRKLLGERAQLINYDGARLILSVPYTDELPDALDNIESKKKSLGITGMSVSLITLEQVFLKVTIEPEDSVDHRLNLLEAPRKITGTKLRNQRISALLAKKFTYTRKNIGILACIMILPLIGVVFMMNFSFPTVVEDEVSIDLSMYRSPQAYFSAKPDSYGEKYTSIVEQQSGSTHAIGSNETLVSALLDFAKRDNTTYMNNVIVAADFNESDKVLSATAMFSNTAIYSLPISLNLMYNAILKSLVGDEYKIVATTRTLPAVHLSRTLEEELFLAYGRVIIFTGFVFPMIALFLIHPRRETMTGIKHLQRMTGVSGTVYWLTMFAFDLVIFFIASLLTIIAMSIMNSINGLNLYLCLELMIILLLMMLFALNALPLMYIISFCKKQTNTLISIMVQVPICLTIAELILKSLIKLINNENVVKGLRNFQKSVFYLLPHMSYFNGNAAFAFIAAQNARCRNMPNNMMNVACKQGDECCDLECSNGVCKKHLPYFRNFKDDPSLEECVVSLACTSLLYFAILFAIEMKVFDRIMSKMKKFKTKSLNENSDEQVKLEKHEVAVEINKMKNKIPSNFAKQQKEDAVDGNFLSTSADNNLFLAYELSKSYQKLSAVKEVSFKIRQRECFGLLGINGAGKSTTFRMLTGEEAPDSGNLFLKEKNINTDRSEYLSQMGYCPQHSAIIETLNAKDHLRLFGLLRGVPKNFIDIEVEKWIDKLKLHICATKPSGTYSGGNKRRLNIAIAMIGNPSLVLLDEPTTGVDPAARRSLWEVIASCQTSGQSIILTSHSMEECEALCNRLVIMVKGELVCIGASQQLKQKFGAGFDIQIKLKPNRTEEALRDLKSEIESRLPCEISDENIGLITYHVTNDRLTWKAMYSALNIVKENHSIVEDYTIISATLEQLFLQFARAAKVSDIVGENNHTVMV